MMIGTLAITGVGIPLTHYGFAGFLSKDAVIESAFGGNQFAFWALVVAAFMTSFYSWRLMFLTFYGTPRGDHHAHDHAHESPTVMLIPLGVLSLGAMFAGMIWYGVFFGDEAKMRSWFAMAPATEHAQEHGTEAAAEGTGHATTEAAPAEAAADATHATTEAAPATTEAAATETHEAPAVAPQGALLMLESRAALHHAHEAPTWVKVSPFVAMVLGFLLAFQFYIRKPELPAQLAAAQRPLYLFLLNKWYFDEIYDFLFVRPAKWLGRFLWQKGDGKIIDGALNGIAMGIVPFFTRLAGRAQSGYVFTYAFAMVLGIAALLTWMTLGGH
jgi:NADH-quinone oxidoreductase subunit L